jgi:hypothetical protein
VAAEADFYTVEAEVGPFRARQLSRETRARKREMTTPLFVLASKSPRVHLSDLQRIASAGTVQQHRDLGPDWMVTPWSAIAVADEKLAPKGSMLLRLVETDQATPDAAAWHSETPEGVIVLEAIVSAVLDGGGQILTGPNSLSGAITHELCEARINPNLTRFYLSTDGTRLLVGEVSDPCQDGYYDIAGVAVTDYVRPPYFDPQTSASRTQLSKLGVIDAPFGRTPGGYQSWAFPDIDPDTGTAFLNFTQEFGEKMPDWQIASKKASAKTAAMRQRVLRADARKTRA